MAVECTGLRLEIFYANVMPSNGLPDIINQPLSEYARCPYMNSYKPLDQIT